MFENCLRTDFLFATAEWMRTSAKRKSIEFLVFLAQSNAVTKDFQDRYRPLAKFNIFYRSFNAWNVVENWIFVLSSDTTAAFKLVNNNLDYRELLEITFSSFSVVIIGQNILLIRERKFTIFHLQLLIKMDTQVQNCCELTGFFARSFMLP